MYFDYLIKEVLLYGVNEGAMGEVSDILNLKRGVELMSVPLITLRLLIASYTICVSPVVGLA
jgi:hypothetical protein